MYHHIFDPPPPLREKIPEISPEVEQVVLTALAKDPKQRFGTVQAFAHALEQASFSKQPRSWAPDEPTYIPHQPPQPSMQTPPIMQISQPLVPTAPVDPLTRPREVNTSLSQNTPLSGPIIPPAERVQPSAPLIPTVQVSPQIGPFLVAGRSEPAPRKFSRRTMLVGFGLTGLVVVAGAGGIGWAVTHSTHSVPPTPAVPTTGSQTGTVHMDTDTFLQNSVTINKGSSLNLVDDVASTHIIENGSWMGNTPKPATEPGAPKVNNLMFSTARQSQMVGPFNTAGTYHLFCIVHPGMNLTVTVQ